MENGFLSSLVEVGCLRKPLLGYERLMQSVIKCMYHTTVIFLSLYGTDKKFRDKENIFLVSTFSVQVFFIFRMNSRFSSNTLK